MREFLFLEMEVAFPSQKKTLQKNELVAAALIEKQRNINEYISGFISKWTIKAPTDVENSSFFIDEYQRRLQTTTNYCCDPKLIRITKKFQKFRPNSTKSKSLCWSVHCIKFLSIMIIGLLVNNFEYWKWQRSTKLFNLFISSCRKTTKRFELLWTSLRKTKCIVGTPDKREMTQSL